MTPAIAAVVIGRNEGQRLAESLRSVADAGLNAVYVDSGSTDDSLAIAETLGVPGIALDPIRPFSAARGRNVGLDEVKCRWPETEYIQFLDGDCTLDPAFPGAAVTEFGLRPDCAIVTGHLSERNPEASVYNRLCAIEWRSPAGPIENMNALGGIMAARIASLVAVGGFNEQAIAGEEPDLGVRLGLAGYSIVKIDRPMAIHDAQMLRFGQWWTRAVRGGHALAHRYARHGRTRFRDGRRELGSVLFWAGALPLLIVLLLPPTRGLSLLLLGGYGLLGWRIYRYYRRTGLSVEDAALAARFILLGKFGELLGILRYCLNRLRGRFHIIEYK
jgi:glycosyltransferase involved in cell wall biosynthesis